MFTIILLGEFVAEVMRGIESQEYWSFSAAATAISGMGFAFVVWWWYFDGAKSAAERHVRTRRQALFFRVWNYSHLPLFLGIGIAGVGYKHLIALRSGERLHNAEGLILVSSVGVLMVALITIGATSEACRKRGRLMAVVLLQCVSAGIVMIAGGYAHHLHKVALAGFLLLACLSQAILIQRGTLMPKLATRKAG